MENPNAGCGRVFMVIVCIVLGLVLTALICGTVYANYLMNLMNRPDDLPQETISQEQLDEMLKDETVANNDSTQQEEDVNWGEQEGEIIQVSENIVNIMLIGQDDSNGAQRSRSDSMVLVTFNKSKNTITMTSFLRDMYVKIPGYASNRLNVPYLLGGMELLDKTLEENFGVQVDGNVVVDFSQFADVIDLLGGVDMELRQDEADYINFHTQRNELEAGTQHLDGEQALFYSRIRSLDADGDFSRTSRQRKVLNALIEQFRDTKLTTLLTLMDDLMPMVTTDLENKEIIGLAKELFPMLTDCTIVSQRVPVGDKYYLTTIDKMSCVVADMDAARDLLEQTFAD